MSRGIKHDLVSDLQHFTQDFQHCISLFYQSLQNWLYCSLLKKSCSWHKLFHSIRIICTTYFKTSNSIDISRGLLSSTLQLPGDAPPGPPKEGLRLRSSRPEVTEDTPPLKALGFCEGLSWATVCFMDSALRERKRQKLKQTECVTLILKLYNYCIFIKTKVLLRNLQSHGISIVVCIRN